MEINFTVSQGQIRQREAKYYIVLVGRCPNYETTPGMTDNIKIGMSIPSEEAGKALVASLRDDGRNTINGARLSANGAILDRSDDGYIVLTSVTEMRRLSGAELDQYIQTEAIADAILKIKSAHAENNASAMLAIISQYAQSAGIGSKFVSPMNLDIAPQETLVAAQRSMAVQPEQRHAIDHTEPTSKIIHIDRSKNSVVQEENKSSQIITPDAHQPSKPADGDGGVTIVRRRISAPAIHDDPLPPDDPEPTIDMALAEKEARMAAEREIAIVKGREMMRDFKPTIVPRAAIRTPVDDFPNPPAPLNNQKKEDASADEFEISF